MFGFGREFEEKWSNPNPRPATRVLLVNASLIMHRYKRGSAYFIIYCHFYYFINVNEKSVCFQKFEISSFVYILVGKS